jgi:hypothetical protein
MKQLKNIISKNLTNKNMAQKLNISICLDDLIAAFKAKHPRINKSKNGKTYASATIWVNDEADKFGNDISLQLYDKDGNPKNLYIGNGKTDAAISNAQQTPMPQPTVADNGFDDLPF